MSPEAHAPDPRYPVGRFQPPPSGAEVGEIERAHAIEIIAELPGELRNALDGLEQQELDTPYREGGWTVRQLVHHIADSHATAFFRYKLALTTDWPTIVAYPEAEFAKLQDSSAPPEWSLEIIEATHARWVMLMQSLTHEQWQRGFKHPERGPMSLETNLLLYSWHSRHHLAHITHLRAEKGW